MIPKERAASVTVAPLSTISSPTSEPSDQLLGAVVKGTSLSETSAFILKATTYISAAPAFVGPSDEYSRTLFHPIQQLVTIDSSNSLPAPTMLTVPRSRMLAEPRGWWRSTPPGPISPSHLQRGWETRILRERSPAVAGAARPVAGA